MANSGTGFAFVVSHSGFYENRNCRIQKRFILEARKTVFFLLRISFLIN